jgi:alkylation response protein AidB-like acyl-CoA dehydrogenase
VTTADVGQKMGIRMMATTEVNFKDVRVPLENLIGEENKGFYHVLHFFDESRIQVAAQALGTAQGAYDRALAYVKQREQFGKKIAQFQVTSTSWPTWPPSIELARLITYKAAWNFDQGRIDPKLTSMAKMYAARPPWKWPTKPFSCWGLRLHDRIRGGALLPRRQDHRTLRRHQGNPEEHHRQCPDRQIEIRRIFPRKAIVRCLPGSETAFR